MINMNKGIVADSGIRKATAKVPVISKVVTGRSVGNRYIKRRTSLCGIYCKPRFRLRIYHHAVSMVRSIASVIGFQRNIIGSIAKMLAVIISNNRRRSQCTGDAISKIPKELYAIQLAGGIGERYLQWTATF